jgi:CSLREA domain-containing protein
MRQFAFVPIFASIAIGLLSAPSAMAATFIVNSTADAVDASPGNGTCATTAGACTLRAAIQEANALAGSDTITLPAGVYTLTLTGANENNAATGDLDVTSTIIINGAGASTTIIDANSIDRVFDVRSAGALTLNGVTVRRGFAILDPTTVGFPLGGGILVIDGGSITISSSVVRDNAVAAGGYGGGILALGSAPPAPVVTATITNSTVIQNGAPAQTLGCGSDCKGGGGGIGAFGKMTLTISDSTISGNTANDGAGIASGNAGGSDMATVTITKSTISGNTAARKGGGVGAGGGFGATSGTMTIANSTISGNTAADRAGALLYEENSLVQLINVTISNNASGQVAAVFGDNCSGSCPRGELRVQNTIIANNTGAASANCATGGGNNLIDLGNNLEFPGTACGFALASDVRANPLLAALANNGGPTQTHGLTAGSPAIDAGKDTVCAASPVSGVDQRGAARPAGAHCDMGSYEFGASVGTTARILDLDGDGQDDLVWRHAQTGDVATWLMNGSTVRQGLVIASAVPSAWQIIAIGDVDGDRKADLIWRQGQTGDVAVWLMNGAVTQSLVIAAGVPLAWQIVGAGDLDGDARADLVWRHAQTGDVAVWLMNGSTVTQSLVIAAGVPVAWQIVDIGDLDGDGKGDLIWRDTQTGDVAAWLMNGVTVRQRSVVAAGVPLAWQIAGVGDLDGDGKADLVWRHTQNGDVAAWLMNGVTVRQDYWWAPAVPPAWQIAALRDVDGDRKIDLVWRDTTTGDVGVWLMDGAVIRQKSIVASGVPPAWQIQE